MDDKAQHLERYLAICKRIYERMERDNTWPWRRADDSQKSEDLVESDDNLDHV